MMVADGQTHGDPAVEAAEMLSDALAERLHRPKEATGLRGLEAIP
jgi:hypothetical protein